MLVSTHVVHLKYIQFGQLYLNEAGEKRYFNFLVRLKVQLKKFF